LLLLLLLALLLLRPVAHPALLLLLLVPANLSRLLLLRGLGGRPYILPAEAAGIPCVLGLPRLPLAIGAGLK
jgi:hypothetical protein